MKEIEKIIAAYEQTDWSHEKLALGTVVKVEGSAYRRIGARMLVSSNGQWTGGISGGCLEGDALKRAQIAILKDQSSIVVYDTTEEDPHQIGVGLGCNGRIEVLLTPIKQEDKNNQIEFLKQITGKREPTLLFQILSVRDADTRLGGQFFSADQVSELASVTQISDNDLHATVVRVLQNRKSKVYTFQNAAKQTFEILFELIPPKVRLVCVGDNYDVNAFVEIAEVLGWEIHVAGKKRKLSKAVFQAAKQVYTIEEAANIVIDDFTAIILMSHDYKTDYNLIQAYAKLDIPYVGLLGPKKRMRKMQDELQDNGIALDLGKMSNLYAPVGLDIGAESPEEIALAISAEIIAVFRKRNSGFLRDRIGTIH